MRRRFFVFFGLFLFLYGAVNYYIGMRFLALAAALLGPATWIYWAVVVLGAGASLAARMRRRRSPGSIGFLAATIGDYWLAFAFHGLLLWGLVDFIQLLIPLARTDNVDWGLGVASVMCALFAHGYRRAHTVRISRYNVAVNKRIAGLPSLRAVLVSDLHLGTTTNNARLAVMVEHIVALAPDIVFFAGDIIDGDISAFAAEELPRLLHRLVPRFGCYAVLGNHEYIGANPRDAVRQLESAGVTVLVDRWTHVNSQFYVVGRNDAYASMRSKHSAGRRALVAVMEGVDCTQPIILLDHQPIALREAEQNGVDLMLSGHTHHGQFFPNQFLTKRMYAVDWGYLRQGVLQVIVSCGFGTWRPPIRTSGYSEIVEVNVSFRASVYRSGL